MGSSKHRITFKVLVGYVALGLLATISGILVLSEIKTFTKSQRQDILDQSKILRTGSFIADIYENENLARAAIQLNSSKKFKEYVLKNEQLLLRIDSLNFMVNNASQELILDSIKLVLDKKYQNIIDLKNIKLNDNSDESINEAIDKLSSIDPLLGKISIEDFVKAPQFLDKKTLSNLEEYVRLINKYNPQDSINSIGQRQIDSLLSVSKNMLKEAQNAANAQRKSLQAKEYELIENDLITSRKLRELLSTLERDIIFYANNIGKQREKTLNHSKNIILFAAGISFIIIVVFSIIILNDFWKSQRYRAQLEKANETTSSLLKSREQLISMVSHDLRTPLSTITGYSELLQNSVQSTKEQNYIEHIGNASAYMSQLVDDLLEFSKLEDGKIPIEYIPFDLKKLLDEIVQNAKNLLQDKPINFVLRHDEAISHPIVCDPFRIKQILHNLVVNAYKFTNEGIITITSCLKEEDMKSDLLIAVSDTGIGISEDQQKNIFKAFTQADSNRENRQNGFGLGLAISKKLVELLGGTLSLVSKPGKGSTFTIKIPITFSDDPLDTSMSQENKWVFNLKAMILEDDVSMRRLLVDLLKQYGIQAHVFDNAHTALGAIEEISFDFVLTDIQLPKMNGVQFMEILRRRDSYKRKPIIAMTGRANLSIKDYIDGGFSEVLIKPFRPKELQNIFSKYFGSFPLQSNTVEASHQKNKRPIGFSIASLSSFLNHDTKAIKKTLGIFLEDTKKNASQLKQAMEYGDIKAFNMMSHKMLSMFRQLEAEKIISFLETFESCKVIDNETFIDFEYALTNFEDSLENFIN